MFTPGDARCSRGRASTMQPSADALLVAAAGAGQPSTPAFAGLPGVVMPELSCTQTPLRVERPCHLLSAAAGRSGWANELRSQDSTKRRLTSSASHPWAARSAGAVPRAGVAGRPQGSLLSAERSCRARRHPRGRGGLSRAADVFGGRVASGHTGLRRDRDLLDPRRHHLPVRDGPGGAVIGRLTEHEVLNYLRGAGDV